MQTSAAGRKAITEREGNKLTAYKDSVGVWTVGVGHSSAAGAPKVVPGMKITAAQSDEILSRDLKLFEGAVNKVVKVPLNQNEFDALVSLAFNIGSKAFAGSTLVRKLNAGDRKGAAAEFAKWNKADGRTLAGLTSRRKSEREQFLKPVKAAPIMKLMETPVAKMAISLGDIGPLVAELKRNLNALGYGPLPDDDVFDDATKAEVEAFQAGHNGEDGKPLKVDGIAGLRTSKAIQAALLAPKIEEAQNSVPATASAEVKEKTGLLGKATAWITGASAVGVPAVASEAFQADWRTVVAIGGLVLAGGLVTGLVVLLLRRWLIAAFRDINKAVKQ